MRRAARRDVGEDDIVKALRACGAYVKKVNDEGAWDLLVWYRGYTLLLEVKDGKKPPSAQALTPAEQKFHDEWPGDNLHIVNSVEAALDLLKSCR
jgi:hypothetical protein